MSPVYLNQLRESRAVKDPLNHSSIKGITEGKLDDFIEE